MFLLFLMLTWEAYVTFLRTSHRVVRQIIHNVKGNLIRIEESIQGLVYFHFREVQVSQSITLLIITVLLLTLSN